MGERRQTMARQGPLFGGNIPGRITLDFSLTLKINHFRIANLNLVTAGDNVATPWLITITYSGPVLLLNLIGERKRRLKT